MNSLYKKVARQSRLVGLVTPLVIIGLLLFLIPSTFAKGVDPEEKVYYYLSDHLGGVDAVLDEEGNVVERRDYLPYGGERMTEGSADEDYGFTGKELDKETGLYYYGARYYDPVIGRFASLDPWEGDLNDPQTLNKYSYVLNNPVRYIDPTGMYNMETGEVEKNDTLSSITTELNDQFGTDYTYKDTAAFNNISNPNLIRVGDTVKMGGYNNDGSTWLRSYDSAEVTIGYWNGLNEGQKQITHYGRNLFMGNLPKYHFLNSDNFENMGVAIAHNLNGVSGNQDYRGKNKFEGYQVIYDKNGVRVDDPENMGTFDFISPKNNARGHARIDVRPWLSWGNSPQDTSTRQDRVNALSQSIEGRAALAYFSYLRSKGE
ncbi:LysM peptidoglycan-binding domain-containing protein [Patescibacteria group bacterium]|nr:LysM peptidoglycan-binding domain-containing protein [Patescibacteria group bacterium]